ncbi:hypothetical protein PF010_g14298 [Phytophthora fragariae]|uniref:Uncharacterized protein n=2 Tax=Phytophthora fragariae TaxID=53985 RepID=A0A6A3YT65_9STRA|nr:hypothetical protein PF010_g14298 [Phytophthora fragariae]KAE9141990.1 hypothetical protein PF006_g12868 [Phytophthora fragariae]KAE9222961.1 hypothetical protein PF002_g15101 [Phytophthora fragariae]
MKPNLLVLESVEVAADVAFEAVWEGVEYVVKEESVGVPAGVTFEAVVELFSIQLPMASVTVLAMVAKVTFEAVRYGTEYVESVEGVGDVEVVAVGEPFPMHAQMIQMVTD